MPAVLWNGGDPLQWNLALSIGSFPICLPPQMTLPPPCCHHFSWLPSHHTDGTPHHQSPYWKPPTSKMLLKPPDSTDQIKWLLEPDLGNNHGLLICTLTNRNWVKCERAACLLHLQIVISLQIRVQELSGFIFPVILFLLSSCLAGVQPY